MSVEKDRWLQQALRHAPDHDVAVPEALRDTILAAARAAVRQPQPVPPRHWWQGLMEPLAHPTRLGYSGAFMALLVVGLWGLDRLDPPAMVPEQTPVLGAPASPAPANATSASPATPTTPAEPALAVAVADKAAPKASAESRQVTLAAKAKVGAQAERQRREEAPPAAAPTQAAAPVSAPPEPAANMVAAAKPVLAAAIPSKAAPSPVARSKAAANAAEPANPLAAMLSALQATDGARWQTTLAQGVHGFMQSQWLGRLQQLAPAGLWQPAAVLPEDPPTVQWLGRDGGQLWLQPDGRLWLAWHGQAQSAHLPPAEATALRAQLAEWR